MIPRICANCSFATNINNGDGQVTLSMCSWLPILIGKRPDDNCGQFSMAANPTIQVDETPKQEVGMPKHEIEYANADEEEQ